MLPQLRMARLNHPFQAFTDMQRDVDRLLNLLPESFSNAQAWVFPTDVRETAEALEYSVEVPGLRPDDIELTVENGILTVAGEKKAEQKDDRDDAYRLVERRYGRFERSFRVPTNVDANAIEATYTHGVLTVRLPKAEEARPRRIEIRAGDTRAIGSGK